MFSVIIPLYNKEDFIENALKSVLAQTYNDFELIVVNDGSTDASEEIIKKSKDSRIKIITLPKSGVSAARNTGILHATRPYIAFLDADDWWAPTFLEEMALLIQQFSNASIFSVGREHVFKERTWRYTNQYVPAANEVGEVNHFQVLSKGLPAIHASSAVISKKMLTSVVAFKPTMQKHEDHELWMRLCINNPIVFLNKTLSFYNKQQDVSASKKTFLVNDFTQFISTIKEVNQEISEEEQAYFKKYYQRFIVLSYIKYRSFYTKEDRLKLFSHFEPLLTSSQKNLLKIEAILPIAPIFDWYKNNTSHG